MQVTNVVEELTVDARYLPVSTRIMNLARDNRAAYSCSKPEELINNPKIYSHIQREDPKIAPLIKCFMEEGIPTFACCQGGPFLPHARKGYVGFEVGNHHVDRIVRKFSLKDDSIRICFSNTSSAVKLGALVRWPYKITDKVSQEMIDIVKNKIEVDKVPEIIGIMSDLNIEFLRNRIGAIISRKSCGNNSSVGDIDIWTDCFVNPKEVAKLFDEDVFYKIESSNNHYIMSWDDTFTEHEVCLCLKNVLDKLQQQRPGLRLAP